MISRKNTLSLLIVPIGLLLLKLVWYQTLKADDNDAPNEWTQARISINLKASVLRQFDVNKSDFLEVLSKISRDLKMERSRLSEIKKLTVLNRFGKQILLTELADIDVEFRNPSKQVK